MQSWAMQRVIEGLDFVPETIDYSSDAQRYMHSTLALRSRRKELSMKAWVKRGMGTALTLPLLKRFLQYNKDYRNFSKMHLRLSDEYFHAQELKEEWLNYDIYIVGSDQIWAPGAIDSDDVYYLPFVSKKPKIAYAPSLGGSKPADDHWDDNIIEYVKDFDSLSSREQRGCEYIERFTGKKCTQVLDPTLLLDRRDFEKIEQKSGINGKFIFFYSIGYNQIAAKKLAGEIRKKTGLPVITWNPQEYIMDQIIVGNVKQPKTQNPGVWLDLIKNAEYVLTTSFHGLALSAIYQKKVFMLKKPDNRQEVIRALGLSDDRFITDINQFSDVEVDYSKFNKQLKLFRSKSLDYLRGALNSVS